MIARMLGAAAALAFALGACAPKPAQPAAGESTAAAADQPLKGWQDADGPGETALIDAGDGGKRIVVSCAQESKLITVSAASDVLGASARVGPAKVFFGAAAFDGMAEAYQENGEARLRSFVSVTPEALAALGAAKSARLVVGDGFAETATDEGGRFAALAARCAGLTGVAAPAAK